MKMILIRGVPGTGKSTLAQKICDEAQERENYEYYHLESDMFFNSPFAQKKFKFDQRLLPQAHKWCQATTTRLLHHGFSPVVANTFCQQWEIEPYINIALFHGVKIHVVSLTTVYGNVHNIPDDKLQEFSNRWQEHVSIPLLLQGETDCAI